MGTPDIEHGRVYFKQFGAERVNYTASDHFWRLYPIIKNVQMFAKKLSNSPAVDVFVCCNSVK